MPQSYLSTKINRLQSGSSARTARSRYERCFGAKVADGRRRSCDAVSKRQGSS